MSYLGIDLGTGGVRCLLVNEVGEILEDVSRTLTQINTSQISGHSEQEASEWIKNSGRCIRPTICKSY